MNLRDNFCNLASLGEVDQICVMQEIRISLFQEKNISLILAKERDARGIYRSKFFQVLFKMIRHKTGGVLQRLQKVGLELVLGGAQPVDRAAVEGAGDGQHAVKVVVLL